jgi:tetratricopeptide (TPR) repeat protein
VFYCAKAKSSIGVEARQVCRSAGAGPLAAQSRTPRSAMIAFSLIAYQQGGRTNVGSLANKSSLAPGTPSDHHVVRPDRQPAPVIPDVGSESVEVHLREGQKWLKEAAKRNPEDSRAEYQLALLYKKEGREEEAKQAFSRTKEQRDQSNKLS